MSTDIRNILERWGLFHARSRSPLLVFVLTMLILSAQRLIMLLAMSARFEQASAAEVARAMVVGLRFDAVIAGMLAVPLVVLLFPAMPRVVASRAFKIVVALYGGGVVGLVVLASVVDFFFFQEFGRRMGNNVLIYIGYDYVWATLFEHYPLIPAIVGVIGCALAGGGLIYWLGFDDKYNVGRWWHGALWPAAMGVLLFLVIRGTTGPQAINTGPAYFTTNTAVSQLTLNGLFTLREAVYSRYIKTQNLASWYDLLPADEAMSLAKDTAATSKSHFTAGSINPLQRIVTTNRPTRRANVVLVIMESMSWQYIAQMGGQAGLTPNLNRLIQHGVFMDRCFSVGERTSRGAAGAISGFPDLPGDSVTTRSAAEKGFLTLGSVLAGRGYETMFIYGGQPSYDHRQSFLGANGYHRFVFENEFATHRFKSELGWSDGDLFRTAHQVFSDRETHRPFFATLLTLSFHRPYQIPEAPFERVDEDRPHARQLNAIRYTDWVIGQFFDQARQADYFDHTLFVFVADHPGGFKQADWKLTSYRVPFLIYSPKLLGNEGRRISTVCSQADVPATILSLLGGTYRQGFFGSNVIGRDPSESYALIQPGDGRLGMIDGQQRIVEIPPYDKPMRRYQYTAPEGLDLVQPTDPDQTQAYNRLGRRAIAVLQTADRLFREGKYQRGAQHTMRKAHARHNTTEQTLGVRPDSHLHKIRP